MVLDSEECGGGTLPVSEAPAETSRYIVANEQFSVTLPRVSLIRGLLGLGDKSAVRVFLRNANGQQPQTRQTARTCFQGRDFCIPAG
jgi:hypothetical protein